IIGAISLCARRGIIIKDPAVLERVDTCRTAIFDKTGTLTYGKPKLTEIVSAAGNSADATLQLTASLERYSKHPLSGAILQAAQDRHLALRAVSEVSEKPGQGLTGTTGGRHVRVTSRARLLKDQPALESTLPPLSGGLECVVLIDRQYAA